MNTEFLVWRHTACFSLFLLVFVGCTMQVLSGNVGSLGKINPRGNHWAVGHLMGKKSTDDRFGSEDSGVPNNQYLQSAENDKRLKGNLQPPQPLTAVFRALLALERPNEIPPHWAMILEKKTQWENEQDRNLKEVAQILLQTLTMKDNSAP
uniref:Gastrin-releasing peptide n=1 Tax=Paramormyrops kingsleyae TaxID=1676925 RepID=A0A3B3RW89_9TELE|nr:gastrin-releasing peptide [Paramormyrops kingsleyae]